MLAVLLIWIYIFFVTLSYAAAILGLYRRFERTSEDINLQLPILSILGLVFVGWLSSGLSLFFRIGLFIHLLIFAGSLLCFSLFYKEIIATITTNLRRNQWWVWPLALLGFVTIILYAIKIPSNPDTSLYHAQAIRWIEEYPAVPGLGNLDPRLGVNSTWFVLNALFSFSFLNLQSFHVVPSFLFLASLFYFLDGFQNILKDKGRLSHIFKISFIPFAFYILIDEISSPGTDLPVILYYWVILCLWLEAIEESKDSHIRQFVVFLLSVTVITYKVSGALILLAGIYIIFNWLRQKRYYQSLICIGIAGAILVPWLIRNYVLSGYWFYPEPLMKFFSPDVDWKIPVERVITFKQEIQAWAISPHLTWSDIANLSVQNRLNIWFFHLTTNQKGIFVVALFSPILFGLFYLIARSTKKSEFLTTYWVVLLISYLNLLFWVVTAPNFRFGYGYVVGAGMFALSILVEFIFERLAAHKFYLVLILALILSAQQVYVMLGSNRDGTQYLDHLILPASYPHAPSNPCKIGGATIFCARNWRQCGYDAFPCVAQAPDNVELRGNTFRDGFHWIYLNK